MDTRESLKSAVARFHTMVGELGRFMADSETVFLATGSSLQHLESEANRVLAESAGEARMGKGEHDPAATLREGLSELDLHLEQGKTNTEKGLRALTQVLAGIEKLSSLDGELRLIIATLHALASGTRLENAKRGAAETGFASVVSDLRTMAREIEPKFGEVLTRSREVRITAESVLAQARLFLDRHRRQIKDFRQDTRTQLATMANACQTSETLAGKSTDSMSQVRSSVGTVLQSLQVQDLARQMIEHVVQDLEEFASAAQGVLDARADLPELRSWLAELALVSRVESAQLGNATDRLVSELSHIDRSLQSIVSALSVLAKDSASFSGKNLGTSLFARLENGIRIATQTLRAHDEQTDSMVRALSKVREAASGIEELVGEVALLGEDARFIGLNAMVKAGRVGQAGSTLTVLAREIQTVSDQIQSFTASAASIMESVAREASALVDAHGQSGSQRSSDEVSGHLEQLIGKVGSYQSSLTSAVNTLLAGSNALRLEVAGTSRALQQLVEHAKRLRSTAAELGSLHRLALLASGGASRPPGRSNGEFDRHTMEQERQVLRAALGDGPDMRERIPKASDAQSPEGTVDFF